VGAFLEVFIASIFLYVIVKKSNDWIPEHHQIPKEIYRKSIIITLFITLGISYGIRCLFELFAYFIDIIEILNNVEFHFAVMATLFLPLNEIYINKGYKSLPPEEEMTISLYDRSNLIKKILLIVIIITWVVALIFSSFGLLNIYVQDFTIRETDIFYLGFIWTFFVIIFDVTITSIVNRSLSNEKRLPKDVLKKAMRVGAIVSFAVWSVQLIIFEIYLPRLFGIRLFEQDIRVLIGVVSGVYISSGYIVFKKRILPKIEEESKVKIQEALEFAKEQENGFQKGDSIILDVEDLTTYFYTEEGIVKAVEGVSFKILEGEVLGLVGETGCGKSVTALSILQLIRPPGKIEKGKVLFRGENLVLEPEKLRQYRGKEVTMIFQDPLNSINPVYKVGDQISEVYLLHMEKELLIEASKNQGKSIYSVAKEWTENLLRDLNIPAPEQIIDQYPHELSGGMRQRIQIAMGLACSPKLLIADEPTTALDVTVQNQILKLMKDLKKKYNTSILFITHDLGIISKMCDRVAVMYSGFIVEYGKIKRLFSKPYHPYTTGLISSVPVVGKKRRRLEIIDGMVPNLIYPPSGCRFHPRCKYCFEPCDTIIPRTLEVETNYFVACHLYDPEYEDLAQISIKKAEQKVSIKE
jgi:oligopeptide/dipeptide ABC transporter ATP-binding protein